MATTTKRQETGETDVLVDGIVVGYVMPTALWSRGWEAYLADYTPVGSNRIPTKAEAIETVVEFASSAGQPLITERTRREHRL